MGVCVSSMPSTALVALQCARLASGSWAIAQRRAGCEPRSLKRWPAAKCTASSRRCSIRDDLAQIQARGPAICACFQRPHRCLHQSNGDESALSVAAKQLTKPYSLMPIRPSSACASAIAAKDCSTLTANASQLCAWCRRRCSSDLRQRIPAVALNQAANCRAWSGNGQAARAFRASSAATARSMASINLSFGNGFVRKTEVPLFDFESAKTSSYPVMKIAGTRKPRSVRRSCSSSPLKPGIKTSSKTQHRSASFGKWVSRCWADS